MTAEKIAALNDAARATLRDCRLVITQGVAALDDIDAVIARVQAYNGFTANNDPYGEHDFGVIEHEGQTVFWQISYHDADLLMHSLDASDPAVTCRVLTIMLAEEY